MQSPPNRPRLSFRRESASAARSTTFGISIAPLIRLVVPTSYDNWRTIDALVF